MGVKRISELPAATVTKVSPDEMLVINEGGKFRKISAKEVYDAFVAPRINLALRDAPPTDERRRCGVDLPSWITDCPQPPRQYTGPVSPRYHEAVRAADVLPHVGQYFLVFAEGEQVSFVSKETWLRMKPWVPIYGERMGDRMVVWDRIVDEHNPGRGGYREYNITEAELGDALVFYDNGENKKIAVSALPPEFWRAVFGFDFGVKDCSTITVGEIADGKVAVRDIIDVAPEAAPNERALKKTLREIFDASRGAKKESEGAYLARRKARIARRLQDEAEATREVAPAPRDRPLKTVEEAEERQREKNSKRGFFGARIGRIDRILRY